MNSSGFSFPKSFFVTGTDTDVGKTFVSAILVAGLSAMYWKPVQTGSASSGDRKRIRELTNLGEDRFFPERFFFPDPVSPHAAAEDAGISLKPDDFILPETEGFLVVEGAGGVLTPIGRNFFMADLIRHFEIPALLVTRTGLGTLNHTCMAVEALKNRGVEVFGLVAVGKDHPKNLRDLPILTKIPLLAHVPWLENHEKIDPPVLFQRYFQRKV